jgi:hypothetical protein
MRRKQLSQRSPRSQSEESIIRLIGNLGPNFDEEHVQLVNKTVEIKEELFYVTIKTHYQKLVKEKDSSNHLADDLDCIHKWGPSQTS